MVSDGRDRVGNGVGGVSLACGILDQGGLALVEQYAVLRYVCGIAFGDVYGRERGASGERRVFNGRDRVGDGNR